MMTNKDNVKLQNERHQLIIQELLRDEDNKYCVDCDAKGPRWASWNIGVFLCIRCAGIHRNLGVHISKVKSVNLDTWTPAQLAAMREMGNSRARAIYEARLPDNFRRPQTDSALETFIRAKYEQKRYMAPEYVPTKPDVDALIQELLRLEQAQKKRTSTSAVSLSNTVQTSSTVPRPSKGPSSAEKETKIPPQNAAIDLLGLDTSSTTSPGNANKTEDLFGQFTSSVPPNNLGSSDKKSESFPVQQNVANHDLFSQPTQAKSSLSSDLLGLEFPGSSFSSTSVGGSGTNTGTNILGNTTSETGTKVTKDSILALYQQTPSQPNLGAASASANATASMGVSGLSSANLNHIHPPPYSMSQLYATAMNTSNFNGMTMPSGPGNQFLSPQSNSAPMGQLAFNNNGFQSSTINQANWSDPKSWSAFQTDQSSTSQSTTNFGAFQGFGSNSTAPNTTPAQQWNYNPSSTTTSMFGDGFGNAPVGKSSAPQTYLSQVQNQLAGLQIGTTNQFP